MKQQIEHIKYPTFAIDVGYGNTKSAWALGSEIKMNMFPSLAPLAANTALNDFGGGVFKGRNVITVEVDGARYEVGPGVEFSGAHVNTGRALAEDFTASANYAALLGGALYYAGAREVERLVLGLPVHNTQKYAAHLKDRFAGDHDFGWGNVHIGSVLPLPQPLGTLINYIQQSGKAYDPDNAYLVIDVGYFTTDWVVARGYTVHDTRSGGVPGGAARIHQQVASLITADRGETVDGIERIDKAIREAKPLVYFGQNLDVGPYLAEAMALTHQPVKEIQSRVGRTDDLRAIILTGGGAQLYAPAIRAAFPLNVIHMMEAPCFANVRGFYTIGAAQQATRTA
ncbi:MULTISPECIES: PRTRC system protein D [Cupriavidus]|uniref:PRTRC system protein D n=1 Tax=Cupriavidus oxalaticus TaxID=96344 RepID=A0A4P7LUQ9_9BURK|nr:MULTISPECIES: PRTRC system protein D [Cupriavidus]MBF6989366.1 PRTRC system protein D [Cupriavidus sp. IK-TO18]QBY56357.1 PRTRC system protein D [Cupriavidus oxalaticus]